MLHHDSGKYYNEQPIHAGCDHVVLIKFVLAVIVVVLTFAVLARIPKNETVILAGQSQD